MNAEERAKIAWRTGSAIEDLRRATGEPLSGGGGGGTSGGMEARIARLEAHAEHSLEELKKLSSLPERIARLEERVAHLPSKGFIVSVVISALAVVAGISTYVQWVLAARGH